ncbi:MAG: hypothetical protein OEX04_14525 [Acidimicrobiia bacterium]|nr:hypothetical protein [Acidimicrobiia bacterium]MDH4308681.1 hypothetical protein [Acidimicrobiia bacterium]MDH5295206.1 hypothetical protein [Acidimicrobiia bacterium]
MEPRVLIRGLRLILILAAVALAAFPLLVLLDLAGGGTGYGLCPQGVRSCRNPYTAAPELMAALTFGLIVVLGGFRLTTRLSRRYGSPAVRPDPRR